MKLFRKRAQSVLEYTLILGVVIGAIIVALFGAGGGGSVKASIQSTYTKSSDALDRTVSELEHGVFEVPE